jgi:hypothetical protein
MEKSSNVYEIKLSEDMKKEIQKYANEAEMSFDEFIYASINLGLGVASGEFVVFENSEGCNCHDNDEDCCGGNHSGGSCSCDC